MHSILPTGRIFWFFGFLMYIKIVYEVVRNFLHTANLTSAVMFFIFLTSDPNKCHIYFKFLIDVVAIHDAFCTFGLWEDSTSLLGPLRGNPALDNDLLYSHIGSIRHNTDFVQGIWQGNVHLMSGPTHLDICFHTYSLSR